MNLPEIAVEQRIPIDLDAPCLTNVDYSRFGDDLRELKGMEKMLNEQRLEQTRPLDESKKRIIAWFEKPLLMIADAINRRRAQMRLYELAEAHLAKMLQAELAATGEVAIIAEPKAKGVWDRDVWKFEITDPKLIPAIYLMPDEKKIGAYGRAMKEGAVIPGVRFYKEISTAIRSA